MSKITIILLMTLLSSCSLESTNYEKFKRCWNFYDAGNGVYKIDFVAATYPRAGTIFFNYKCPSLRIVANFDHKNDKILEDLSEVVESNGLNATVFSGVALLRISSEQQDSNSLRADVEQLISFHEIRDPEASKILHEMAGPRESP